MTAENTADTYDFIALASDIVAAYVSHNSVPMTDLAGLIASTHRALIDLGKPAPEVTPDYIICLEDGRKFRSLKRHLNTAYGLTPGAYRAKWGLPHDYPMVAPNYAAVRSDLAKKAGLGVVRPKLAAVS